MRKAITDLSYPHYLLIGLVCVLGVAGVYAGVTSAAAFGSYNPAWDGAGDLQRIAADTETDATIFTATSEYEATQANGTLAVVLSPDQPYTRTEQQQYVQFLRDGGTLLVAADFKQPGNQLLSGVGSTVRVDGRTLRDERRYYRSPALPLATNTESHRLTSGVDQLTLNYGSVIIPGPTMTNDNLSSTNTTVLVQSSEFSYLDSNGNNALDESEQLRSYPIVTIEQVGDGQLIVVSDPSLFINAMIERPGNQQFVANLFTAHDRVILDQSHTAEQPPLSAIILALRKSSLLTALVGALILGGIGVWVRYPRITAKIGRWGSQSPPEPPSHVDQHVLAAYLQNEHPTWNSRRIQRIMTGVLAREAKDSEDE